MKNLYVKLAVFLMAIALVFGVSNSVLEKADATTSKATITLYKSGKKWKTKTVVIKKGDTVLSATKRSFKVVEKGGFVNSIEKVSGDTKKNIYWMLYVNGKSATKGAGDIKLKSKDKVKWSYEKVNF